MSARSAAALTVLLAASLLGSGASGASAQTTQEEPFPHATHQGLFPLCTGCHEGIPLGNEATYFPQPATCTGCHDGVREVRISWSGPSERVSNVAFTHQTHDEDLAAAGDAPLQCASCHIAPGGGRMAVTSTIELDTCLGCHAHRAQVHQVDADCAVCHVPLARTEFTVSRIASLAEPPDHEAGTFLNEDHGRLAESDAGRCATCHTRQRCVACHVDADRPEIQAFPAAPAGMELPPAVAHYNEPRTHQDESWLDNHGLEASRESCATCHTSNDCRSCHVEPVPTAVAALPARADVVAPGVRMAARAPESHDSFFFEQIHSTLAAAGDATCATCHEEAFCVSCHDAPRAGGYHPTDFLARHTASAFGRDTECSNCHNTQVFCRSCHVQVGLVSSGRLGPGYHDDGPAWLLRHGQAARQNLESCASCHRQIDCTQCHGVLGAFKVSPHSPSFDAERALSRSPRACLGCHIGNPLDGNEP